MRRVNSREHALALDASDPLRRFRDRFHLPPNQIYLDGNSLGPLSRDAEGALLAAVEDWRRVAVEGWPAGVHPWFFLAEELAKLTAPLVGAEADEVIVANSTTVNLHQLLCTLFDPRPPRRK